jgi:hypothetical protein
MDEGRDVVQMRSAGHDQTEHRSAPQRRCLPCEAQKFDSLSVDKPAPLHEVFGWIATDDLLGQGHDRRAVGRRGSRQGDRSIHIRSTRTDRGVDIGECDADEPHSSGPGSPKGTLGLRGTGR